MESRCANDIKLNDFCFAADDNFATPLEVAVGSLIWSMRNEIGSISIHVLDLGINDSTWEWMSASWKSLGQRISNQLSFCLVRHKIDDKILCGYMPYHGSIATYARLLLPEILKDVDWCLYADCDVLFIESPRVLSEYCQNPSYSIIGHKDVAESDEADGNWFRSHHLPFESHNHICAGFILMNLALFRERGFVNRLFGFLDEYESTTTADQCALYHVCRESIGLLPHRWGVIRWEIEDQDIATGGGAIHYAGGLPWKVPVNCTDLLGANLDVANLWQRFAIEIMRIDKKLVCPRLRSMIRVGIRALVARILQILSSYGLRIGLNIYLRGLSIQAKTIRQYKVKLFGE